jgi:hypothetical protein
VAPAFELTLSEGATERSLIALLAAATAAALAAWLWSHLDARFDLRGHQAWAWLGVAASAGIAARIAWRVAVPRPCTVRWQQDRWSWIDTRSGIESLGTVEPRLDLGSWMLLALRTADGVVRWAAVGRRHAGAGWHPLRAALFAPVRRTIEPAAGESAPT